MENNLVFKNREEVKKFVEKKIAFNATEQTCCQCGDILPFDKTNGKVFSHFLNVEELKDLKFCGPICAQRYLRRFIEKDSTPYNEEMLAKIKNINLYSSKEEFCSVQGDCNICDLSEFHSGPYDQSCKELYDMVKMKSLYLREITAKRKFIVK